MKIENEIKKIANENIGNNIRISVGRFHYQGKLIDIVDDYLKLLDRKNGLMLVSIKEIGYLSVQSHNL